MRPALVMCVKVSPPQPELSGQSRTAPPSQTKKQQEDQDPLLVSEVALAPLPGLWLTSTAGVQTPARWMHVGSTPAPPDAAAPTDPTLTGEGSASFTEQLSSEVIKMLICSLLPLIL